MFSSDIISVLFEFSDVDSIICLSMVNNMYQNIVYNDLITRIERVLKQYNLNISSKMIVKCICEECYSENLSNMCKNVLDILNNQVPIKGDRFLDHYCNFHNIYSKFPSHLIKLSQATKKELYDTVFSSDSEPTMHLSIHDYFNQSNRVDTLSCELWVEFAFNGVYMRKTNGPTKTVVWLHQDNQIIQKSWHNTNNELHRINKAACIYYQNEVVTRKAWYQYGYLHCIDGPAVIIYDDNGNLICQYWYMYGEFQLCR